jgi:hypothetical protein
MLRNHISFADLPGQNFSIDSYFVWLRQKTFKRPAEGYALPILRGQAGLNQNFSCTKH